MTLSRKRDFQVYLTLDQDFDHCIITKCYAVKLVQSFFSESLDNCPKEDSNNNMSTSAFYHKNYRQVHDAPS